MTQVAWATEQKYETRVVIYETPSFIYNAHAQAQVLLDGRWQWVTNCLGMVSISDNPDFYISGYEVYFTPQEYLIALYEGVYQTKGGKKDAKENHERSNGQKNG